MSIPGTDPATATTASPVAWSRTRLLIFRFGAAFFAVQFVYSWIDASYASRAVGEAVHRWLRDLVADLAPSLVASIERLAARGDAEEVLLGLARDVLAALLVALLWNLADRRRHHERLGGALRVVLRYLVAVVMAVYAGVKVVPVQFQPLAAEDLLRPLGDRTPMGLLWAFMASSPAYTMFTGLAELAGASLLFWRRTTALGALILIGVLANVALLNFAYDVPVKRASVLLLVACIALVSRDVPALAGLFVGGRGATALPARPFAGGLWARRVRVVLKPLIVVGAIGGPLAAAWFVRPPARSPLEGVYAVDGIARPGTNAEWRRVVLAARDRAVVQTMAGAFVTGSWSIDATSGVVRLRCEERELELRQEAVSGGAMRLLGNGAGLDEFVLQRVPDPALRVRRR